MTTLPQTVLQRIALRKALGQDGYHDALLKIASGDTDTLAEWDRPLTADERTARKQLIFDLWLAGGTTHDIARQLVIRQNAVFESVQITRDSALNQLVTEDPPVYNVWNFNQCDPRFGQPHPGQIQGQVLVNLLLWLTEPYDMVVDPMAGGGTTIDVCKYLRRRYRCFDIDPRRPDIQQWDVSKGYPRLYRKPSLIFLDPPYWRLKRDEYSKNGAAMGSYKEWLKFMGELAESSAAAVKPGGHIALMSESFLDEKETGRFLFINRDCTVLFEKAGLKGVQEISVNFTSGIKSFRDVQYAKQKGILLDLKRDLLVFKRSK